MFRTRSWIMLLTVALLLFWAIFPVAAQASGLKVSGRNLLLNGQAVILRGANFANIRALGATTDGGRIGTGNPNDVDGGLEDYQLLRSMGGNHVRFGIDYYWYIKSPAAFWSALDRHVGYAQQTGVFILLNSFGNPSSGGKDACYEGYSRHCDLWGNATNEKALIDWWTAIATRYKGQGVMYDPVNEPTPPGTVTPQWSSYWLEKLAPRVIAAIAAVDPSAIIFIEAGDDASFTRTYTGNIVYEAHSYAPLDGTHCVYGTQGTYPGSFKLWDGVTATYNAANLSNPSNRASIYSDVPAIEWGKANNVPVYIGEWGIAADSCFSNGLTYMADVAAAFNKEGLHWAVYSWRAGKDRWGTFPEVGALKPYQQAKYDMLVKAFGGAAAAPTAQPTLVPSATKIAPTATAPPGATATPTCVVSGSISGSLNGTPFTGYICK